MEQKKSRQPRKATQNTKKTITRTLSSQVKTRKKTSQKKRKKDFPYVQTIIVLALILTVFVGIMISVNVLFKDFLNKPKLPKIAYNSTVNKTIQYTKNSTVVNQSTSNFYMQENLTSNTVQENQTIVSIKSIIKPQLVIVIDDVMYKKQIDAINKIPLKLSPSFLPNDFINSSASKNTKYAKFHLVHLPLEANNHKFVQNNTLLVSDSYDDVYKKLYILRQQFPDTIFYNGHTGSKFTADKKAMDRLFKAMDRLGLVYVESRTIATTKGPEIAKKYDKKLLQRDIFLDHEIDEEQIQKQLDLVVDLAKKNGSAFAIGHPHPETLNVLTKNVNRLNDEVEVIYLRDLYYEKN